MKTMIKIEWKDWNETQWHPWAYWPEENRWKSEKSLSRMHRLYRDTTWMFRLSPTDESDDKSLRKLLKLQRI